MTTSTHRSLRLSSQFVLSSGTVTLGLSRREVLLITHPATQEAYLPKGRKNIDETLPAAAIRETYEETGYKVELFALPIRALATGVWEDCVTEPVAVTQRIANGVLKIIFWFAAVRVEGVGRAQGTQDVGEEFEARWVRFEDVGRVLTFEDDTEIVRTVWEAVGKLDGGE